MRLPHLSLARSVPLAALLSGCGADAPPPPPPRPSPVAAEQPPPAPPPPPSGRVLLVASEFGLSPLACFLDAGKAFATGDACLDLAPIGAEVWLSSGPTAKVTGRGTATCPGADPSATITVDAPREHLRGDAVLPPALKDVLVYVPPEPPPEVDRAAPKELRDSLAKALTAAFPALGAVKPRIDQRARLDLDGDGTPEQLVAVAVPGKIQDDDELLRASALFLVPDAGAPELLRARTDTRERYTVIGALDLDGDGPRELYLNTYDADGFSLSLERREAGGLVTLGRWACGA